MQTILTCLAIWATSSVAIGQENNNEDLRAGGDEHKRFFQIGAKDKKPPRDGYKLLLVMPGGSGSADFNPFVRRIQENAAGDYYLVAQLVAPVWDERQAKTLVWPTKEDPWKGKKFDTSTYMEAVIEEVTSNHKIDRQHIYALGWSSAGPPIHGYMLNKKTRLTGALVAMSVFWPKKLPSLKPARDRAYYLLQSPEDEITTFDHAEKAIELLTRAKAKAKLVEYAGGHGWHGDMFGNIRDGLAWLEQNHSKPLKR